LNDSTILGALSTNLNSFFSETFDPHTHPFWVIVARPVGDLYVTYTSDTPGC